MPPELPPAGQGVVDRVMEYLRTLPPAKLVLNAFGDEVSRVEFDWPWPCHREGHIYVLGTGRCVECRTPDFDALDMAGIRGVLSPR